MYQTSNDIAIVIIVVVMNMMGESGSISLGNRGLSNHIVAELDGLGWENSPRLFAWKFNRFSIAIIIVVIMVMVMIIIIVIIQIIIARRKRHIIIGVVVVVVFLLILITCLVDFFHYGS